MIRPDEFTRDVYGVLGIPIDAINMAGALRTIENAAANSSTLLLSTSNLNFLVTSQSDAGFRESLLLSDLCTADGMPIVWIARLLGVPIGERIAGSDLFEALRSAKDSEHRLKVFFFGGVSGVAVAACNRLNLEHGGLTCAGYCEPGVGTVDEMSTDSIIDAVNTSGADFLVVAIGAKKGQAWLLQNHDRLRIPVRAHLGTTINFQAGTVRRAPVRLQRLGLEWLWRIKEEPQLWTRYWNDGRVFLELMVCKVAPLLILAGWDWLKWGANGHPLQVTCAEDHKSVILSINGDATRRRIEIAVAAFQQAAAMTKPVVINFTNIARIDARFLGLLVMLRKHLRGQSRDLSFTGVSPRLAKFFRLNGFGFLLQA